MKFFFSQDKKDITFEDNFLTLVVFALLYLSFEHSQLPDYIFIKTEKLEKLYTFSRLKQWLTSLNFTLFHSR